MLAKIDKYVHIKVLKETIGNKITLLGYLLSFNKILCNNNVVIHVYVFSIPNDTSKVQILNWKIKLKKYFAVFCVTQIKRIYNLWSAVTALIYITDNIWKIRYADNQTEWEYL